MPQSPPPRLAPTIPVASPAIDAPRSKIAIALALLLPLSGGLAVHSARAAVTSTAAAGAAKSAPHPKRPVFWHWDARAAAVQPGSAAKIAAFQEYAVRAGTYFVGSVAWVNAAPRTPTYTVPLVGQQASRIVAPIPVGTRPGATSDHHLTVLARDGTSFDFWLAHYDPQSRRIVSAGGAGTVPRHAPFEVGYTGSNAAGFPLRAGPVTPKDVRSGAIQHALHLTMPNVGPAPNPFPARAVGYPGNTGLPLGTWLRLDPSIRVRSLHLPKLDRLICIALQRYGAFVRDIGPTLSVLATDQVNQGGNGHDWPAVGVPLPLVTPEGVPYARPLSRHIPWDRLQVLRPPKPS